MKHGPVVVGLVSGRIQHLTVLFLLHAVANLASTGHIFKFLLGTVYFLLHLTESVEHIVLRFRYIQHLHTLHSVKTPVDRRLYFLRKQCACVGIKPLLGVFLVT